MLRHTNRIRHASLSGGARLFTIGFLATLGLLVAGLRGPGGWELAQAQAQAPAKTETVPGPGPANEPYKLAFVPADAKIVLAIRPAALVQHREIRTLVDSFRQTMNGKAVLVFPPDDVEQLVAFWEGIPQHPVNPGQSPVIPLPSGAVVRFTKPIDWKAALAKSLGQPVQEAKHDAQTYFHTTPIGAGWCLFAPDDRTLVLAQEDLLFELIEDRKAPAQHHAWDEVWNKSVQGQVMLALETRWLRRRLAQGMHGLPAGGSEPPIRNLTFDTVSPLLDKTQSYALGLDASDGLTVDLVAGAGSEADAKAVAGTLQALLTLGQNAVSGWRQDQRGLRAKSSEAVNGIIDAADSLLDKARLETTGSYVHFQAKSALAFAEAIKFLTPAVAAAEIASRRNLSANNLKQIALAFHNYHGQMQCFPAPALYGGKRGNVPYSWRIAILPFLEQQELYAQYDFDEPWDGPNNRKLIDKMPAVYGYPGIDGRPLSQSRTAYFVFTGEGTALSPSAATPVQGAATFGAPGEKGGQTVTAKPVGPMIMDITDGVSNTILLVESKRDVPWTKPEDIPFDPNSPSRGLEGFNENGFNAAFADGAVRFISKSIDQTVLKALITRAGGEPISFPR